MEAQMEQESQRQRQSAVQAPGVLDRFMESLNNLVNFVLNRAPKSDAATRQDVRNQLEGTNPQLAQRMKMETATSSPGHNPPGRAFEREVSEPSAKKKG